MIEVLIVIIYAPNIETTNTNNTCASIIFISFVLIYLSSQLEHPLVQV